MELEKPNSAAAFIGSIAEKLGTASKATTIFGEPVHLNGLTVIPVAKARWGFGGGAGTRDNEDGAGGGGGAQVTPVGFIEMKNGGAEFRPIRVVSIPWLIAGGLASALLLRRILR